MRLFECREGVKMGSMFAEKLQEKIEELAQGLRLTDLMAAAEELTTRYRSQGSKKFIETERHRIAYLLTRMPATYAAIVKALTQAIYQLPPLPLHSFLDLGSGPGTGMWAVKEVFPSINRVTLFEKDEALAALGRKLAPRQGQWVDADLDKAEKFPPHDLVLLSYSLGELSNQEKIAKLAFEAAEQLLLIVEPGTPLGFERLKKIRTSLIREGAFLVAPCPHSGECPLKTGDWCHFSARLPRSSLHRQMKGGSLGHEDEKFFYLAFSKKNWRIPPLGRILRHPRKSPGFVEMTVCCPAGVERKIFTKREKEAYKRARKAEWGELIN